MQGRRFLGEGIVPFIDNIHQNTNRSRDKFEQYLESSEEETTDKLEPNIAEAPRMKDFTRSIIDKATSCIQLGKAAQNYELKSIHFNQLPSFYGIPKEDPLNFIREFYLVVQTFPLHGLNEDQLRMRCFSYTLNDHAKS